MKKTIKVWAVVNPIGKIMLETVDTERLALDAVCYSYNEIGKGFSVRPILITYDDGRKK